MDVKTLQELPPWEWPNEASEVFRKTLIDRKARLADRILAAELAGEIVAINDELAETLVASVGSPDDPEELRARAAISLGPVLEQTDIDGFDDPYAEPPISEETFDAIKDALHRFYEDQSIPKEVRRRVLEASVRAQQDWHADAIRAAYASGDREWMLTAVFAMRFTTGGFDEQILEALKNPDPEIYSEAVRAAGRFEMTAASPLIAGLVENPNTEKWLRIAAIGAFGCISPNEARGILSELSDSEDEDIAEAADEALMMMDGSAGDEDDEEDDSEWIN